MVLDKQEVGRIGVTIKKALESKSAPAEIIKLLKALNEGVHPTEQLLRATKIGRTVTICSKHPNREVRVLASGIVDAWRDKVKKQKLANGGSSVSGTPDARSNGTASPAPSKAELAAAAEPKPQSRVPLDKRTWKTDKISHDELTGDEVRNKCICFMYDGLCYNSPNPSEQILAHAKAIEQAALDLPAAKGSSTELAYRAKIRSVYLNLKPNPELQWGVLSGKISHQRLVTMTDEELKSRERMAVDAAIEKKNLSDAMVAQEAKSVSTSLQCGKCGQKKVNYSQAQTRSADEPMTTFCECLVCGKRWKFS